MDDPDSTYILDDDSEAKSQALTPARARASFPLPAAKSQSVAGAGRPAVNDGSESGSWQGNDPELAGGFQRGDMIDSEYRVVDFLGSGGAGGVYLVEHRRLKQKFALKILHGSAAASEKKRQRFIREAQLSGRLEHPGIVKICNFGIHSDPGREPCLYYVMQFVTGEVLQSRIKRESPLPLELSLDIAIGLADALSYAHGKDVIHRDIKPANIFLTQASVMPGRVKLKVQPMLLDFGLARSIDEQAASLGLTGTKDIIGTPVYISPEQSRGRTLDPRSDFYSLGVTIFHMVAGSPPLLGSNGMETILLHQEMPAPAVKEINPEARCPEALERVLARCLQKQPADRYQSAEELYNDLVAIKQKLFPQPAATVSGGGLPGGLSGGVRIPRSNYDSKRSTGGSVTDSLDKEDIELPSDETKPFMGPMMLALATISLVLLGTVSWIALSNDSKREVIGKPAQSPLTSDVKDSITHSLSEQDKFIAKLKEFARTVKPGSYLVQGDGKPATGKPAIGKPAIGNPGIVGRGRAYRLPDHVPFGQFSYLQPGSIGAVPAAFKNGRLMELPPNSYLNLLASPEVMAVPELLNGFDASAIAYLRISKQSMGVTRLLDIATRFNDMVGLDLQRNDLDDEVIEYINKFDKLRFLNLHRTKVTVDGIASLKHISTLLLLQVGPVDGDCHKFLAQLGPHSTLACLEIEESKLSDQCLSDIARLPDLKTLNLRRCGINGRRLALLSPLANKLIYLDLQGDPVGPDSIPALSAFKTLKVLAIDPVDWSDSDKARLASALPHCLLKSTVDLRRDQASGPEEY